MKISRGKLKTQRKNNGGKPNMCIFIISEWSFTTGSKRRKKMLTLEKTHKSPDVPRACDSENCLSSSHNKKHTGMCGLCPCTATRATMQPNNFEDLKHFTLFDLSQRNTNKYDW